MYYCLLREGPFPFSGVEAMNNSQETDIQLPVPSMMPDPGRTQICGCEPVRWLAQGSLG